MTGDTIDEFDETFTVNLFTDTLGTINGNGPNTTLGVTFSKQNGIGTILDDDNAPQISFETVPAAERAGSRTNNLSLANVRLSGLSEKGVSVTYKTTNGSATGGAAANSGVDYHTTMAPLLFLLVADRRLVQTITIPIFGDNIDEANETFTIDLPAQSTETLLQSQVTATIIDNDGPFITISDVTQNEGNSGTSTFTFSVQLSAASPQTITVDVQTADGTATSTAPNADYVTLPLMTLTFTPGQTVKQVSVTVNGDLSNEANEFFTLNLSSVSNTATIGDGQGIGTINNDDNQPTISISDVTVTEGNTGTVDAIFTVSLSAPSFQTISVNYTTVDGPRRLPIRTTL